MSPKKMTEDEYDNAMEQKMDAIRTRDDLSEFIDFLLWGYQQGFFEQQPLEEYLSGAANFTGALDGYCKNFHLECPDQPDWKWVGHIFRAAFSHS